MSANRITKMGDTTKGVLIGILCFVVLVGLTLLIDGFLISSQIWYPSPEEACGILLIILIFSTLLGLGIAKRSKRIKVISLILISIFILHFSYGLTKFIPALKEGFFPTPITITIENQTEEVLIITVNEDPIGLVEAGALVSVKQPYDTIHFQITAEDAQGQIVFSQTFFEKTLKELYPELAEKMPVMEYIGDETYKVVIPLLRNGVGNSDNVTQTTPR